jgi:transmembrane sensor
MTHTTPVTHESPEWVLMAKALRGELSDEEQKAFSTWLGQEEAHAVQWAEATEAWQKAGTAQNHSFEPNVALAWEKFCAKAEMGTPTLAPTHTQEAVVRPMFTWRSLSKYAAIFVLAAGLAWLGYTQLAPSESWAQVATLAGERKVFYLPDSSKVILNENSTLRYQTAFTGNERVVELTGEGFFDVKRNPKQPFFINSQQTQTKVLGTSFNVKGLKESKEVIVTVSSGKVSFASLVTDNKVILTPGYTGRIQSNGSVEKAKTMGDLATSWQTIKFESASLSHIESTLENYFNIDIKLANKALQNCSFTGTFIQPELKEVLAVLAASNGIAISQTSPNHYLISGQGCQ